MRLVRVATFAVLVIAACASRESSEEPAPPPSPDADSAPPPISDAGTDSQTDADSSIPPRPKCTADGRWCLEDAADLSSVGLPPEQLRFTGVVMDPVSGSWATSESAVNGGVIGYGTPNMGHLFQLVGEVWTPRIGLRPGEPNALPFLPQDVASDGHGTVVAVGTSPRGDREQTPIVFLIRPGSAEILEDRPTGLPAFTGVRVASPREAWAKSLYGALYHGVIGDTGPIVWTLEKTPHYSPEPYPPAPCSPFWLTKTGDVCCVTPETSPFTPPWIAIDVRHQDSAGNVTWTTTTRVNQGEAWAYVASAGFEGAPGKTWLSVSRVTGDPRSQNGVLDTRSLFLVDANGADPDGGLTKLSIVLEQSRVDFVSFWGRAEDDIWAVGRVGRVFHYDGVSWTDAALEIAETPMTARDLKAISGLSTGELWAVGDGSLIHRKP